MKKFEDEEELQFLIIILDFHLIWIRFILISFHSIHLIPIQMLIYFNFYRTHTDIPRVSAHRSVINTKESDNAELYCDYDSTTESHVVWYKDQQKLQIGTHESRSKYSVIYGPQKSPNKNTSILVVNNVKSKDLGVYECRVNNEIGAEAVTIELTYVPEPPKLHSVERDGDTVITHWHIRSMQKLTEIMLNYQLKGVSSFFNRKINLLKYCQRYSMNKKFTQIIFISFQLQERDWLQEAVIDQEQSKEHTGVWKLVMIRI